MQRFLEFWGYFFGAGFKRPKQIFLLYFYC